MGLFLVFIIFGDLFIKFIACIFSTVAGYFWLLAVVQPEIELISLLVSE